MNKVNPIEKLAKAKNKRKQKRLEKEKNKQAEAENHEETNNKNIEKMQNVPKGEVRIEMESLNPNLHSTRISATHCETISECEHRVPLSDEDTGEGLKANTTVLTPDEPESRVIYIWSVPANGHLNPTLCFTNELINYLDRINVDKIVFYSGKSFKELIINLPNNIAANKTKIEFRDYGLDEFAGSENLLKLFMDFDTRPGALFRMFKCYENSIRLGSDHIFKNLLHDMHVDRPALVLYVTFYFVYNSNINHNLLVKMSK